MKKFLILLTSSFFLTTPSTTIIACGQNSLSRKANLTENLSSLISERILGSFSQQPQDNEVLTRLKSLNSDLQLDQVEVENNGNGQATISVIKNSLIYEPGSIDVYYTDPINPKYGLNVIITNTQLGEYDSTPSDQSVLNRVKGFNLNLDVSQVQVINNENNQATIIAISESNVYRESSVDVFYTVDKRQRLTDVLRITNLGQFDHAATVQEILARVKELNPDLDLSQVQLTHFTHRTATIVVIYQSTAYKAGDIVLNFFDPEPQYIEEVIQIVTLPPFSIIPENNDILTAVQELNPDVNLSEVFIESFGDGKAILKVKTDSTIYYQGQLELTYRIRLLAFIRVTDLGEFENLPTEQMLLQRVKLLNPILDLSQIQVSLIDKRKGRATFRVLNTSQIYQPRSQTTTTFKIFLSGDVKTKDLGSFASEPTLEQIQDRIHQLNPDLEMGEISSINIIDGRIIIGVVVSDIYVKGEIEFTYQITT